MLALSRQEQSEEPLTDLPYLWSHSESYSSCRGERLFARRRGPKSVGRPASKDPVASSMMQVARRRKKPFFSSANK